MADAEFATGDWLGASHDEETPGAAAEPSARREATSASSSARSVDASHSSESQWRVEAADLSFVEASPGALLRRPEGPGTDAPDFAGQPNFGPPSSPAPSSESALSLLNERIDRIEGLIAGELSVRLQDALAQVPTRDELARTVKEAVETSTAEVVGKAVEPLVEAVSQLQAQHEEEIRRREEKHRLDVEQLVQKFNALGDEMARHNAVTEEQITQLQEKSGRRWWPWKGES